MSPIFRFLLRYLCVQFCIVALPVGFVVILLFGLLLHQNVPELLAYLVLAAGGYAMLMTYMKWYVIKDEERWKK
jgi:hypothetical protein